MSSLSLRNITKIFPGNITAVKNFNFEIEDKEFVVLVGPSGCGKSTTLRMIAGLEEISEGEIYIGERLVNNVLPKDRDIAMVFQNYALYPHMSVYDNMAFGLRMRKVPRAEIDRRVREAAQILQIDELLKRKPKALSGGQRQRVALGRAIVRNPKVFLMDEPLSNLDAKLRVATRTELTKLHQRLETTFIYVTHDQTEAMTMGTRIIVMKDGVIQQADSPQNLYDYPVNKFVAEFIGSPQMNVIKVMLSQEDDKLYAVFGTNKIVIPEEKAAKLLEKNMLNKEVYMGIRPEDFRFEEKDSKHMEGCLIHCRIEVAELLGSDTYLYVNVDKVEKMITARIIPNEKAVAGAAIRLAVDTSKLHFFDIKAENALL